MAEIYFPNLFSRLSVISEMTARVQQKCPNESVAVEWVRASVPSITERSTFSSLMEQISSHPAKMTRAISRMPLGLFALPPDSLRLNFLPTHFPPSHPETTPVVLMGGFSLLPSDAVDHGKLKKPLPLQAAGKTISPFRDSPLNNEELESLKQKIKASKDPQRISSLIEETVLRISASGDQKMIQTFQSLLAKLMGHSHPDVQLTALRSLHQLLKMGFKPSRDVLGPCLSQLIFPFWAVSKLIPHPLKVKPTKDPTSKHREGPRFVDRNGAMKPMREEMISFLNTLEGEYPQDSVVVPSIRSPWPTMKTTLLKWNQFMEQPEEALRNYHSEQFRAYVIRCVGGGFICISALLSIPGFFIAFSWPVLLVWILLLLIGKIDPAVIKRTFLRAVEALEKTPATPERRGVRIAVETIHPVISDTPDENTPPVEEVEAREKKERR